MPRIASSGWTVRVTHPQTGRTVQPDVLDEPTILPSLNSLPEIRIPVRKSDVWLDPGWENNPDNATLDVWLDGVKQPIDILQTIEDREDRTILVGIGATELRDRVSAEYRSERRHIAAKNLITGETTYAEDVDTPSVESVTGETLQSPTTTAEIEADLDLPADNAIDTSGDEVTVHQTCFVVEGEDANTTSETTLFSASRFSGNSPTDGSGYALEYNGNGQSATWDFTPQFDIAASDLEVKVRWDANNGPQLTATLNGDSWVALNDGVSAGNPAWDDFAESSVGTGSYSGGDLSAGTTYTFKLESTTAGGTDAATWIDLVAPVDNRSAFSYTFDDTLSDGSDGGRYLDGPGFHPENGVEVMGEDETSAFSIVAADATISIDDTTGDQYLQVSNDRASNWEPDDGTQNNTASVDVSSSEFPSSGSALRLRFNLDAYSPNGTKNQTPRENYDAQTVTDWTLNADIDLELLLINQNYDNSLVSILNDIAGSEFVWSANLDSNGNYQVSWTQPGQRTASDDPDIGNVQIRKNIDTFDRITIRGSNKRITGETFNASTTFVDLNNAFAVPGSETVYDDAAGTTFDLDSDYEMNWQNDPAQIRALDGGDLDTSQSYSINYDIEVEGSYPSSVTNPDREFVDTVPGVVTDRGAEQIAFALFDGDAENPRYEGDLSLPRVDAQFDVLEALTLDNLDLPSEATPLETRGEPEITPSGLTLRLGSRPPIEQSLSSIAENVAAISKRT